MKSSLYINFATAVITFIFGVLLLAGILYPGSNNSATTMFGIVLIIYGLYRFVNSISKIKQAKLEERRDKINQEKEKFISNL
ncbi:MAG: hypothetical protein M3R36_00855 [Bacteroidota bacterium]|nr:hypothetical protein [Bacteroidota bacterium]